MATAERRRDQGTGKTTHEVFNQSSPLAPYNPFEADRVLREAVRREGAEWAEDEARELGAICGRPDVIDLGRQANENPPRLRTHDRFGNRIDEVEFHPAWHELMRIGVGHGLHASPWREPRPGAHVARAAKFIQLSQVEAGVGCPISMTYSVIPAMRTAARARRRVGAALPLAVLRRRAAGPDARQEGRALRDGDDREAGRLRRPRQHHRSRRPLNGGGPAAEYEITGHKWFCSAPMCDAFLVLAQADGGLSCFLLPRFTPDGERNAFHIQRLKDKLGNRSNASSEVEFRGAWARLVGEEGRGVPDDHRDGQPHAARLRDRRAAPGFRWGTAMAIHHATHRVRLRQAPGRPAADAERARRPRDRVRGGDDQRTVAGARLRRGARRR